MKRTVALFVFLLAYLQLLANKNYPGYILYKDGTIREVTFTLATMSIYKGAVDLPVVEEIVKYVGAGDEWIEVDPKDVLEIGFTAEKNVFYKMKVVSVNENELMDGRMFGSKNKLFFFHALYEGKKVQLYANYYYNRNGYVETQYLYFKSNQMFYPRWLQYRKDLKEIFSDCPQLVSKLDKKDLGKGDEMKIVSIYENCVK